MTIGQRIAQKRKELGFSQEALGDKLGVSRQAIYKWESDAALPEIEKLVTLSKLFGVSVGWLLAVEEEKGAEPTADAMSQAQLDMVSEIVDRYIKAQPQPKPRRKWPWVLAVCLLVVVFIQLFSRMDQLSSQYTSLQNSVGNITYSVNSQINGITTRVEEILKAQNQLTAQFDTQVVGKDYYSGTVNISMKAVPKTYVQGMRAVFVVDCGNGPMEFEGTLTDSTTFRTEAQVSLTDSITVSVAFIAPDGIRQTQVLKSYSGMLSDSYADLSIHDDFDHLTRIQDGTLQMTSTYVRISGFSPGKAGGAEITQYRVGLFRDKKLVGWCEPCDIPPSYSTNITDIEFFMMPVTELKDLQEGELVEIAVLVTDSYGRQYMCCDIPHVVVYDPDGTGSFSYPYSIVLDRDPEKWDFS